MTTAEPNLLASNPFTFSPTGENTFTKIIEYSLKRDIALNRLMIILSEDSYQLSRIAYQLLMYIGNNTPANQDHVKLDSMDIQEKLGVKTRASIHHAIRELIEHGYINRHKNTIYHINPSKIFTY